MADDTPPTDPTTPAATAPAHVPVSVYSARVTWEQVQAIAALVPLTPNPSPSHAPPRPAGDELARRVRAYLARVPVAVAGQHGHDRTFYMAGRLVRGYDLTPDEAMPFAIEWNSRCDPPWPERDLYRKLCQADKQPGPRGFLLNRGEDRRASRSAGGPNSHYRMTNYYTEEVPDGQTMKAVRSGIPGRDILEDVTNATSGWPKLCGGVLFYLNSKAESGVQWVKDQNCLFAWAESKFGGDGQTGVDWASRVAGCMPKTEFFEFCVQNDGGLIDQFQSISPVPHEPPMPGVYYSFDEPKQADPPGSAMAGFLKLLCPSTPEDSELIRGMLMTLLWGGPPGSRPAFVITSPKTKQATGHGAGKTTLAKLAARLVGGFVELKQRADDFEKFKTRLLSPDGMTKRIVLLDNVKTTKFSWDDLEGFITQDTVSGHRLFHGEGQRPNIFTVIITMNGPALSRDIAQRCIPISLDRPTHSTSWEAEINQYVERNLNAIRADIIAELRLPAGEATVPFRWGLWQNAVLSRLVGPDELIDKIKAWQDSADEDSAEADQISDGVATAVAAAASKHNEIYEHNVDPSKCRVFISARQMAAIASEATGEKRSIIHWSRYLANLNIRQVSRHRTENTNGWVWIGTNADPDGKIELSIT